MSKINVLDSTIYNRISAGEVVEKPASVVKELVENCIDAGANFICIEIESGGKKLIRITDNGCGIDFEDLKKAFLPHSTSKIKQVNDLDNIFTLGFRGEALASIASVSRVELISNTKEQDIGGKIVLSGGTIEELTEYPSPVGTSICVNDLFFNTPARLKFLKSDKQEESAITNIVERLMFANPNISFKYVVDGKTVYNANAKTLKDKIYTIYGREALENLIEVSFKNEFFEINGYISKPTFCKANKTYQTLMINNRYVNSAIIGVAISNAYENFLMKGKFPFFVLNLKINFEDVDVNVHPSKMEVKFKENNKIYNLFYSVILETLTNNSCVVDFGFKSENHASEKQNFQTNKKEIANELQTVKNGFSFDDLGKISKELGSINLAKPTFEKNGFSVLKSEHFNFDSKINNKNLFENDLDKNLFEIDKDFKDKQLREFKIKKEIEERGSEKEYNDCSLEKENFGIQSNDKNQSDFSKFSDEFFGKLTNHKTLEQTSFNNSTDFQIIGTIFNTYIIVESGNEIVVIDQHAGHERILFDKLMDNFEKNKIVSQPLLIPYSFTVNGIEKELIENNLNVFFSLGFEVENFGFDTYRISAIPSLLDGLDLGEFVLESLKDITKISNNSELIKLHFAKCACKSAVKGGQKLSNGEIEILLNQVFNNKTTLLCPHGRPICLKKTKTEIEKMFKRIV